MGFDEKSEISDLLEGCRRGDREAFERLVPLLYGELRRLAGSFMKGERPNHTLQPTALVHEACLRMMDKTADWQDRHGGTR